MTIRIFFNASIGFRFMSNQVDRFDNVIASLDGDEALFSKLALPISEYYEKTATQVALLAENEFVPELSKLAHKLKSTWLLYVDPQVDLPAQLEQAARENDKEKVLAIAARIVEKLEETTRDLRV